ncbi:MAG: hypothetical protein MZW92_43045 [Comamonadaceae bacterium]|nr:hypothetical protein [Comamonadaceae bacterium]
MDRRELLVGSAALAAAATAGAAYRRGRARSSHAPRRRQVQGAGDHGSRLHSYRRRVHEPLPRSAGDRRQGIGRLRQVGAIRCWRPATRWCAWARRSPKYLPKMAALAGQICDDCEKECRKHEKKHAQCKACADACAACLKECRKVAASPAALKRDQGMAAALDIPGLHQERRHEAT